MVITDKHTVHFYVLSTEMALNMYYFRVKTLIVQIDR